MHLNTNIFKAVTSSKTIEEAEVYADIIREKTGRDYRVNTQTGPRSTMVRRTTFFHLQWLPKVGEGVVYSINADTYYDGKVTKVTKTTFTTESGRVFRWSAKRQQWHQTGCSYVCARPGKPEDAHLDPHF